MGAGYLIELFKGSDAKHRLDTLHYYSELYLLREPASDYG